MIKLYN